MSINKKLYIIILIMGSFFYGFFSFSQNTATVLIIGQGLVIGTPVNLNLGVVSPGNTVEVNFTDYFWIEDLRGTSTGHYTTIQCDGLYGPSNFVITGVLLSGSVIEKIGGTSNNTLIYSNLNGWTDVTEPKLYLYRNENTTNPGGLNTYGNKPSIRVSVPEDAPVGSYKGKITYTLYDMAFNY